MPKINSSQNHCLKLWGWQWSRRSSPKPRQPQRHQLVKPRQRLHRRHPLPLQRSLLPKEKESVVLIHLLLRHRSVARSEFWFWYNISWIFCLPLDLDSDFGHVGQVVGHLGKYCTSYRSRVQRWRHWECEKAFGFVLQPAPFQWILSNLKLFILRAILQTQVHWINVALRKSFVYTPPIVTPWLIQWLQLQINSDFFTDMWLSPLDI